MIIMKLIKIKNLKLINKIYQYNKITTNNNTNKKKNNYFQDN